MRILCLGDSPHINTGFGVVNRVTVETLKGLGHQLIILGGQDFDRTQSEYGTFIPARRNSQEGDIMGWAQVATVIQNMKPDAISIVGDPAMVTMWNLHPELQSLPTVAYMPVEGAPLNMRWTKQWEKSPNLQIITCSNYGAKVLSEAGFGGYMAYHGVSPEFRPYSPEEREAKRHVMGWDDKFIVLCVAQNVGRKNWPRLFEALALMRKKNPDVYLYAHTVPFNAFWLGGHDLPQLVEQIGVADRVIFNDQLLGHNDSVPLSGGERPGLVDFYNMADCFVLPSKVEGFGLPLAEAMACGLPVATTNYAAQAEVVGDAGILLPVHDWEWNQSHSRYANVHPRDIAWAINRMRNPEIAKKMRARSIERAKTFTWDKYRVTLAEVFGGIEEKTKIA